MPSTLALAAVQFEISAWRLRSESAWAWVVIGLVAGWLAGYAFRGRGFGCVADIVLGLIGSVVSGWLFTHYGMMGGDFFYSLAAAAGGAIILVAIAHLFGSEKK